MQFALHNLRGWGNKKIVQGFYNGAEERDIFLRKISVYNTEYYNLNSSSYSFLRNWAGLSKDLEGVYDGFVQFVYYCVPCIGGVSIDNNGQRRFKNMWFKIWKNIGKDLCFSDAERVLLCEFGIRLAYILDRGIVTGDDDLREVVRFYNALIKWALFTQQEENLRKNKYSCTDVVEVLILTPATDFIDRMVMGLE